MRYVIEVVANLNRVFFWSKLMYLSDPHFKTKQNKIQKRHGINLIYLKLFG